MPTSTTTFTSSIILVCLAFYQAILSPDHGIAGALLPLSRCRFYPSCSEYTRLCVRAHGARKGLMLGLKQLARCHPFQVKSPKLKVKS